MDARQLFLSLLILSGFVGFSWAGTPEEDAYAQIGIAQAIVEKGKDQPDLNPNSDPAGGAVQGETQGGFTLEGDVASGTSPRDGAGELTIAKPFAVDPIQASVLIRVRGDGDTGGLGSGTVIECDDQGSTILTSAHIGLHAKNPRYFIEYQGDVFPATRVRFDEKLDLALYHTSRVIMPVEIAQSIPGDGKLVRSIGLNSMSKPMVVLEHYTYGQPHCLITSGNDLEGRSGGVLFYENKLVGVYRGYEIADESRCQYISLDPIHDFLNSKVAATTPPPPLEEPQVSVLPARGMKLIIQEPAGAASVGGPVEATVVTASWCEPCHRQEKANGAGNEKVHFTYVDESRIDELGLAVVFRQAKGLPVTCWEDNDGVLRYVVGFMTTDQIVGKIERNNPPTGRKYLPSGAAGAIHASGQIRQAIEYIRRYVGENVKCSMSWDRNGAQSLPLLARTEWTAAKIFGQSGRFEIDATGAVGLPVTKFGFGYRLRGDDIQIDADPVIIAGLAKQLEPNSKPVMGAGPSGLFVVDDMVAVWGVFSAVRGIGSLLWPSVDLTIPGQVSGSCVLSGETMTVDFPQPVTIRIKMLFSFNLAVNRIVITEKNVHLEFGGSRMIRSRDFAVQ